MSSNPLNLSWELPKQSNRSSKIRFGWKPDLPDNRDFSFENAVKSLLSITVTPTSYELDEALFSPIEDQKELGSCTANAAAALIEYMEKKAKGTHIDVSRLFLYKVTRKLMGETGDTGAYLRDTMKAMRIFGALPEEYWPYTTSTFDQEPTPFHYAIAGNFKSISYFRVDQNGMSPDAILASVKSKIARGLPLMFGFTCFSSLYSAKDGVIPFPNRGDKVIGGHAVALVGYNDNTRQFKIRNSWGTNWGVRGYGYLSYDYLLQGLMADIWGVSKQEWIDTGVFN